MKVKGWSMVILTNDLGMNNAGRWGTGERAVRIQYAERGKVTGVYTAGPFKSRDEVLAHLEERL